MGIISPQQYSTPASTGPQTGRLHICKTWYVIPIGKESNSLEEVEAGVVHSAENVYTVYPDPRRDEWQTKILAALRKIPLQLLVKLSGMSRSTLIEVRAGRSRPHHKNQELLASIVRRLDAV
jgi:hypothetical protein